MTTERPQCCRCGGTSPATDTNYTLISAKHGWRLVLEHDESNRRIGKWWCPECWSEHRERRKAALKSSG